MLSANSNTETQKEMGKRKEHDFYPTPPLLAAAALEPLAYMIDDNPLIKILDPCAGGGVWGEAARGIFGNRAVVDGLDIRPIPQPSTYDGWGAGVDFLSPAARTIIPDYDVVMMNPPFSHAQYFVERGLELLAQDRPSRLVALLRLSFLESRKRKSFWAAHPPALVTVLAERPSFSGDGKTDGTAYGFFYWRGGVLNEPRQQFSLLNWYTGD